MSILKHERNKRLTHLDGKRRTARIVKTKPNIFEYIDFKKYLSAWRESEKWINPGLTHEYLCAKLGQKNRTYFSDVEKGRKHVGPEVLSRMTKLLNLNDEETKYFRALVGYGQTATREEREFWFEQVVQLNNTPKKIVDKKTYSFYKEWYHTTVRAFLETCDFKGDYGEASRRLYGRVSPKQVRESVKVLKSLGLISANERGFLKPTDKILSTGDAAKDELLRQYHLSNNDVLKSILEKDEPNTHDSTNLTVGVSREGIERIVKRIRQLRAEIISIAHKDEKNAKRVYKIAVHVYPESRKA
jgi:uncharacterized protein (TIGR02147 family)